MSASFLWLSQYEPAARMWDIGNVPFVAGRSDMLAEPESYFLTGGSQRAR